jgi:cytochrome c oxidase subunit 3
VFSVFVALKLGVFHLVQVSPWPIFSSFCFFNLMMSLILWMNGLGMYGLSFSSLGMLVVSYVWWRDVERESVFLGDHSFAVKDGLKLGMVMFIASEVLFFVSFFWSFIHRARVVDVSFGIIWPPFNVNTFDPVGVPLLNTVILLSSGATVTWSHHLMLERSVWLSSFSLLLTVLLGAVFSFFQFFEYGSSLFSISDRVLGSTFFMSTGFHGLHVLVGSTFLSVSLFKLVSFVNTGVQNVGFECSAWYWHFVDVVWLFLYILVYWWGY